MKKDFKIYLLGHEILKEESLSKFRDKGVKVLRIDVGKELLSYVVGTLYTSEYYVYGNKLYGEQYLCSGGYLGNKDDLIVDDFNNPSWLYGFCNGLGGVHYESNNNLLRSISEIDNFFI